MASTLLERDDMVAIDDDIAVLDMIADPRVHLAIWRRPLPAALAGLADLDWDSIDDIAETIAVAAVTEELGMLAAAAGYPGPTVLARAIAPLATRFAAIMRCDRVRLRLEVIETDACRKFHADQVAARLLMPIVGPGTQWCRAAADAPVHQIRAGEVALFKGRLWAPEPRILHRSPPVAATGATRLLLAIDPLAPDGTPAGPPG